MFPFSTTFTQIQSIRNNIFLTGFYTISKKSKLIGCDDVKLETIGQNIRKYRDKKKMTQEILAEKAEVTTNYIGMIERGEKTPALDTFLLIANALEVSADMLLADVLYNGYEIKESLLSEKIGDLPAKDRERIYDVVDVMIKHSNK